MELPSSETAEERRKLFEENKHFRDIPNEIISESFPEIDPNFSGVECEEKYVENEVGEKLCVQKWVPKDSKLKESVNSVIFYVHGYGNGIRFNTSFVLKRFCQKGYVVIAMDGFGHGKSDGLHAYIPDFQKYIQDYDDIYKRFAEEFKSEKKILVSRSMGSTVSIGILRKDNDKIYSGAIFISPLIDMPPKMYPNLFVIGSLKTFSYFIPKSQVSKASVKIEPYKNNKISDLISNNPALYHGGPRIKTITELSAFIWGAKEYFHEIQTPILVLHGSDDQITCPKASEEFVEKISSLDKTYLTYESEKHGILFDEKAENVYSDIFNWLEKRFGPGVK